MTQLAGKLLGGATQRCGTPKTAAACVKGKQALGAQLCASSAITTSPRSQISPLDVHHIEDDTYPSMRYKRNQVEQAIFRTLGAQHARVDELKFRLKRLLVTDRRLGRDANSEEEGDRQYAFYSQEPAGSGIEVMFSGYEAFAQLAAIMLLEHGLPQGAVVRVMRQARRRLEAARVESLKKDPSTLFDQQAILAQARPGMLAVNNTDPIFLAFVRLTDSTAGDQTGSGDVAVCRGFPELGAFSKKHSEPGTGITVFELVGLIHTMGGNLRQVRPAKRGRGAT
jgi:hypothetical protein